jgi:translation initiation factor IF-1
MANTNTSDEYVRMSGSVLQVMRNATFRVQLEGGLEVMAKAAGRMRRGHGIRILAGDRVEVEVSTYDPTKGRIVWRHR